MTPADFLLQGRVENYRERLFELLVELDRLVREQMSAANRDRLEAKGRIDYEPRPPRWTLAWRAGGRRYEANLAAYAHGGAWVVHGRAGLNRPFRNQASVRARDAAAIRQEIDDQITTDVTVI